MIIRELIQKARDLHLDVSFYTQVDQSAYTKTGIKFIFAQIDIIISVALAENIQKVCCILKKKTNWNNFYEAL